MIWTPFRLLFPPSKKVLHKATGKLRRLGRVNSVHASSIMLICHHNLLVFLAILLRVVQAGSSDSLNCTDGDRLVLSFEAVANLIWKSAHAIFLPQFGICTANHQKKPLIFTSTSWLMMRVKDGGRQKICARMNPSPKDFISALALAQCLTAGLTLQYHGETIRKA